MVEFTECRYAKEFDSTVVRVSLPALIEDWKKSKQIRWAGSDNPFGSSEKAVAKRYHYNLKLTEGEPIEMPKICFGDDGHVEVGDGRHRLAEMFNQGIEYVDLCVWTPHCQKMQNLFGLKHS